MIFSTMGREGPDGRMMISLYDITTDKQARKRFKKLNGSGVPLIFVGEKRVPGFNEGLLRGLLGIK